VHIVVWLLSHSFISSFRPFVLPSFRHHQFPFIILIMVAHILLKFNIWIYHRKMQFKVVFGHGRMIFLQNYAPWWKFQFPFIISLTVVHIQLKFDVWIRQGNAQVKFEFSFGSMIFGRVMPLSLWEKLEITDSVHYLSSGTTHSTQIWHMDTSKECTGQVQILSWFNDFFCRVMHFK
jgi:hypothetical protein